MSRTTHARSALVIAMLAIVAVAAFPVPASGSDPAESTTTTTQPTESTTTTTTAPTESTTTTTEPVVDVAPVKPAEPAKPPGATFTPVKRINVVRKLVFPVAGMTRYWSGFGDCRDGCTREHHGIDIMTYGWKGVPVVAATSGTVTKVTYDQGNAGCSIRIRSRDRWETRYLHLNNDVPGTDEIGQPCPAPGIEVGAKVEAGQIIGWIGDSGNAETTQPHLHFELRNRSGYPIDPYRSLRNSDKVAYEWLSPSASSAFQALSQGNQADGVIDAFAVFSEDLDRLLRSDSTATVFQAPLIVIDRENPQTALNEIVRLGPDRLLLFTDDSPDWLLDSLRTNALVVETASLPPDVMTSIEALHTGMDDPMVVRGTPDRFTTVIAGRIDKIWRSRQDEYTGFIETHKSLVLTDSNWANRSIGERSLNKPAGSADRKLLWWHTGDGWIGTRGLGSAPEPGYAYLTERGATPWNFAHLRSLAELPPMPLWKK